MQKTMMMTLCVVFYAQAVNDQLPGWLLTTG